MVGGELPAAIFGLFEGGLIGEELLGDLGLGLAGGRIGGASDDDAVVPAGVFAGVEAGGVDGEVFNVAELLLTFEDGDLILLEDIEPLVVTAVADSVYPLDGDGLGGLLSIGVERG